MSESSTTVKSKPVNPAAPWIGGKRLLAGRIVERLQAIPHALYAEPFVGMGGVFLRRPWRTKVEFINDLSRDVSNLFRLLQRHFPQLMDVLRWQVTSRAEFERLQAADPATLTDLERAARFLYLQRMSFGGKVSGRTFGTSRTAPARFDLTKLVPALEEIHERLAGVTIECLPWREFIERYDREGALFYLDPPYYGTEGYYGADMFDRGQFEEMADVLASLKGRFLLSLNDHPEVRKIFGQFPQEAVETRYTAAGNDKAPKVGELLIG